MDDKPQSCTSLQTHGNIILFFTEIKQQQQFLVFCSFSPAADDDIITTLKFVHYINCWLLQKHDSTIIVDS
jgi:hypothetical protein